MSHELILPVSMAIALLSWTLIIYSYAHPVLRRLDFAVAMKPLLLLHSFRYIGLMFLIPGVTDQALDLRFASPAAYGDLLAAVLALLALAALRIGRGWGVAAVALFNVLGFADLVNAVIRGLLYTPDGALGATFWIPAVIVPLLLVTHIYIFYRLASEVRGGANNPAPA